MAVCKICLNTDSQVFPLSFNDGICTACETRSEWAELGNSKIVEDLYQKLKVSESKSKYDCVLSVFGDREDWYVLNQLLQNDIKVLVVWVNSYFNTDIAWQNFQALITHYDVDSVTLSPNINVYRKMVEKAFLGFGHILLPYQMLKYSFAINTAIENRVKNVVYTYEQATEFGGTFSKFDFVEGNNWAISEFNHSGKSVSSFSSPGSHLTKERLVFYNYPKDKDVSKKITSHFFSNYVDWDPEAFASVIPKSCLQGVSGSAYDKYYRAGCSVYYNANEMLRFKKFGYIKARDQLSRSIRNGRIDREFAEKKNKDLISASRDLSGFFSLFDISTSGKKWLMERHFDPIRRKMDMESLALDNCDERVFWFSKEIY